MQSWAVAFAAAGLKYFLTGFIPLAQGGVNWAPLIAKSGVFKIHVRQPALVSNLAEFSWVCWPSQTSQAHLLTCPDLRIDWLVSLFVCFFFKFLFLYLAVLGLSCGTQHHLLWHVGLAPWPGMKPPWNLGHWTSKEVPGWLFFNLFMLQCYLNPTFAM